MRIFLDDRDYGLFLGLLEETLQDFDVECWHFCLMPNHYHLLLRPTRSNLSDALQRLNGGFAESWNRRYKHVGHVFQGRFKDQIVQENRYLLTLCRYIALNPVRSGLVETPAEWLWSSYAATIGLRPPPGFLSTDRTLRLFGGSGLLEQQALFARFVEGPEDDAALEDRIRSASRILGDNTFKAAMRARIAEQQELTSQL